MFEKMHYKLKLENGLSTKDYRDLWQGLNQITGYKPNRALQQNLIPYAYVQAVLDLHHD